MPGKYAQASNQHINRYKMAHCIGVAEYMREHALEYSLDPDLMYVVGLLHDIGYLHGRQDHEEYGAIILQKTGMFSDIVWAIRHHGDNPYEIYDGPEEGPAKNALVLLLKADMSVNAQGFRVGFDGRLKDIADRYGKDSAAYRNAKETVRFVEEWDQKYKSRNQ